MRLISYRRSISAGNSRQLQRSFNESFQHSVSAATLHTKCWQPHVDNVAQSMERARLSAPPKNRTRIRQKHTWNAPRLPCTAPSAVARVTNERARGPSARPTPGARAREEGAPKPPGSGHRQDPRPRLGPPRGAVTSRPLFPPPHLGAPGRTRSAGRAARGRKGPLPSPRPPAGRRGLSAAAPLSRRSRRRHRGEQKGPPAPGPPPPAASHVGTERGAAPLRRSSPRLTCLLLPYGGFAAPRWYRRVRILPPPPAPPPAPPPPPEAMLGRGPSAAPRPAGPLPRLRAVTARPPPATRRAAWKERGPRAACPSPPPRSAKLRSAGLPPRARAHPLSSAARALPPQPHCRAPFARSCLARSAPAGPVLPARPPARGRAAAPRPHPPPGSGSGSDQPQGAFSSTGRAAASSGRDGPACTAGRRGAGLRGKPRRDRGARGLLTRRAGRAIKADGHGVTGRGGRRAGPEARRVLPRKEKRLSVVNWKSVKYLIVPLYCGSARAALWLYGPFCALVWGSGRSREQGGAGRQDGGRRKDCATVLRCTELNTNVHPRVQNVLKIAQNGMVSIGCRS